jgi:maltoporin
MKRTNVYTALALAGLCGSVHAINVDFSGYFRAGVGINTEGGNQVCFQAPGADTKWRLGNECDYVIEPVFSAKVASHGGSDWSVVFMPNVFQPYGGDNAALRPGFGQVYAYGTKIAALGNGTVWAGKRFYNRLALGINDQFLENDDGDGVGIEHIDVGAAKLSLAAMTDPNGTGLDANNARLKFPLRITGIKTVPNGELSVYVKPSFQASSIDQANVANTPRDEAKGLSIGLYQTLSGTVLGGNTLIGFKADRLGIERNARIAVQQQGRFGATVWDVIGQYRIHEGELSAGVRNDNQWISIGGRTDTHMGGPFRLLLDVGHDQVDPDNGSGKRNLTKFTIAGAISAGPEYNSRPTLRLFLTHAVWNDAARRAFGENRNNFDSVRLKQVFGNETSGTSIGVQAESWW